VGVDSGIDSAVTLHDVNLGVERKQSHELVAIVPSICDS
jgi:hypothetical protein